MDGQIDVGKGVLGQPWNLGFIYCLQMAAYRAFLIRLECLGEKSFVILGFACIWSGCYFSFTPGM